jgi:hypothetical protein
MQKELASESKTVAFAIVNSIDAVANQPDLVSRADFPLFQDTDTVKAWEAHGGGKDDIYIYGTDGKLTRFLKFGGPVNTDLSVPENFAAVKKIIVETK